MATAQLDSLSIDSFEVQDGTLYLEASGVVDVPHWDPQESYQYNASGSLALPLELEQNAPTTEEEAADLLSGDEFWTLHLTELY